MLEKKQYIKFFHPFYKDKDFSKWVFTIIVWPEDTSSNINRKYHVQSHKQRKAQLTCKRHITSKYKTTKLMDSYTWTILNVKQNLLKTKHIENIGDLDNKERCLSIYFSLGNNYNFTK